MIDQRRWNHHRVVRKFENLGKLILDLRFSSLVPILMAISILKNGLRGIQPWSDLGAVDRFPILSEGYSQTSIGLLAISKVLSVDSKVEFFILNLVFLSAFTFQLSRVIRQQLSDFESRFYLIIIFFSPLYVVLLGNIGRHDILTISGMILLVSADTRLKVSLGLIFALLGSPEHTIATLILLFCLSVIFKLPAEMKKYSLSIGISLIYLLTVLALVNKETNQMSNRFNSILFDKSIQKDALSNFLRQAPLELFSYLGIILFALIPFIMGLEKSQRLGILFVFLIPAIVNILILDKTRDYVVAIVPVIISIFKIFDLRDKTELILEKTKISKSVFLGITLAICLIVPSIELTFEGTVRAPYEWILSKIGVLGILE